MTNTTLDGSASPFVVAAGSTQQANDGDALLLLGTIDNLGTLLAFGTGGPFTGPPTLAQFALINLGSPTVTLTGGGTVLLAGGDPAALVGSSATAETLVNVDNTIAGVGAIGISSAYSADAGDMLEPIGLVNQRNGVIDANGTVAASGTSQSTFIPAASLFVGIGGQALVNDGLMEATGIGGLVISAGTIDQAGGGTILASGAGVGVDLNSGGQAAGIDIIGGALMATGGGTFDLGTFSAPTLDGGAVALTIGAGVTIGSDIVYLLGTLDNSGTLLATDVEGVGFGHLVLDTPTLTLTGGGNVLNAGFIGQGGGLATLVNVDNTISGSGVIGTSSIESGLYGPVGSAAAIALINEAAGVVDADGADGLGLSLFSGGTAERNDGLIEATGVGGLLIDDGTVDQSHGGTLQAIGAGVLVTLQTAEVIGGVLASSGGGIVKFNVGNNTLTTDSGAVTIATGGIVEVISDRGYNTTATLTLQSALLDNSGTLIDASTLLLASPTVTLAGGGVVQLGGVINSGGTARLVNADNTITGAGAVLAPAMALTNAAAGVIDGVTLDLGGTVANTGLLRNVSVGFNIATTIDNSGGGSLLASGAGAIVGLYDADIIGGTLAATAGASFALGSVDAAAGNTVTLDGRGAPVVIEAGATLQDFYNEISLPFTFEVSGGLAMVGTIDFAGTIVGADPAQVLSGPFAIPNAGLLVGAGEVAGFVANTGTLLAQGGTMSVSGDVDGTGGIAIGPGAAFGLGGESGETIDFRHAQNDRLVLNTPTAFTGTLANMTYGDILALGTDDIQSAAVVGGNTLAVTLTDSSVLDVALANLQSGTSFKPLSAAELVVACFAAGTRICTPDGERLVETLRAGDAVATVAGGFRRVVWVGHRDVNCLRHPRPAEVQPMRICAHAFGRDTPHADLLLSPDHAVLVGGVLIPVYRCATWPTAPALLVRRLRTSLIGISSWKGTMRCSRKTWRAKAISTPATAVRSWSAKTR